MGEWPTLMVICNNALDDILKHLQPYSEAKNSMFYDLEEWEIKWSFMRDLGLKARMCVQG